jgi:hypothetical protein
MTKSLGFAAVVAAGVLGMATVGQAYADGPNRQVTLINRSHRAITEFYASNIRATTWEEDILGHAVSCQASPSSST